MREAKTAEELKEGETLDVSVSDSVLLRYTIKEDTDLDKLLHLLQISKKENLLVYINKKG